MEVVYTSKIRNYDCTIELLAPHDDGYKNGNHRWRVVNGERQLSGSTGNVLNALKGMHSDIRKMGATGPGMERRNWVS